MSREPRGCQFPLHGLIGGAAAAAVVTILLAMQPDAQSHSQSASDAAAMARRVAAERLAVPVDRLQVVSTTPAEWRDSSLGCPERGMMYTPAITPGYKVTLREGDRLHVVHVSAATAIVCSSRTDPKLSSRITHGPPLKASANVRAVLAARLRVSPSRVRIVSARPAVAGTCPAAPQTAAGAAFIVEATVDGRGYRYYSDEQNTVACDASCARHFVEALS